MYFTICNFLHLTLSLTFLYKKTGEKGSLSKHLKVNHIEFIIINTISLIYIVLTRDAPLMPQCQNICAIFDHDLWESDQKLNRDLLLPRMDVWSKFVEGQGIMELLIRNEKVTDGPIGRQTDGQTHWHLHNNMPSLLLREHN